MINREYIHFLLGFLGIILLSVILIVSASFFLGDELLEEEGESAIAETETVL